jgi:RimJ/RimL family protein N-acetyltransferase
MRRSTSRRRRWSTGRDGSRNGRTTVTSSSSPRKTATSTDTQRAVVTRPRAAYDTTVESSVYVAPGFQGRGLGREMYRVLLEAVDASDAHRVVAGVALPNPASESLHLEFGFRRVAQFSEQGYKFGRFWDVDWYERVIRARLTD